MKKKVPKIAIMLYTAILHPIITCLIWLSYFHKLFLLLDINTKKEPEHLIGKILMGVVAVKCNELSFERAFVMGVPALFTLGVSGLLFIILLIFVLSECMDRKKVKT